MRAVRSGSGLLDALIALVALVAVAVPAVVVETAPAPPPSGAPVRAIARAPRQVVPPAVVPPVEPTAFAALTADDARAFNASVAYSTEPNPAARPFRFAGTAEDRARARDCLATAALYEAGDDTTGERAVAQVALNRLRHPAFPKSVCAVVFQGSERRTGCQFTFTCDGALAHVWPDAAWTRARQVADAALSGAVYAPVGYATHYHTDWVVPYWSSSLDKITSVGTHLFFRWSGWWGTPGAFRRTTDQTEPRVPQLALRFDAHKPAAVIAAEAEAQEAMAGAAAAGAPQASASDPNRFLVALERGAAAGFEALARRACGDRPRCRVLGWVDAASVPPASADPLPAGALASMSFSYLRDRPRNLERVLWNCALFPQPPARCMRRTPGAAPAPLASPTAAPTSAPPLSGIRRRETPAPAAPRSPAPSPSPSSSPSRARPAAG